MKTKRQRPKLGAILAIPLPDGTYAFGRLYKEYTLGIYKGRSESINGIPDNKEYDFFVVVYAKLIGDGQWPVVGNIPFENEEDAWRLPTYMRDIFTLKYSIYFHGELNRQRSGSAKGLN